ncbi:MAG: DUF4329 domain-containing protein, partial [Clostridia bacterium]|nr:DUF4329 domain-containing protein [Clostridia bacterium]
ITTINYDQAARPEKEILPNEVNIDYSFDECGRLTKLEHKLKDTVLAKSDYTYDENGNRITFTDEKDIAIKYNYDFLNQLKEMDAPNTEIEKYEYDAVGNRETEAGSIDNVKDNEYTYDFENKLIRTENEKDTINYTYDGDGTLIKKTITGSVNETYEYLYDYTAGLPRLLVEKKSDGTTYNYLYAGGRLYARKSNNGTVYYHQDGLGSTVAITDTNGNILNEYTYDVFGEPHIVKETVENSILFTGEPYDQSGLVYLRARYYDPTTGRFISKDTYKGEITDPSSQNSYAYCGNNPVNAVDPSGRKAGDIFDSEDEAAIDFGNTYAKDSADNDWEWFAYIVEDNNGKYTYTQVQHSNSGEYIWGLEKYEYQKDYTRTSAVHSHARFREQGGDSDLRFSNEDISYASGIYGYPFYLANPAGELLKYDKNGFAEEKDQIFLIATDLPRQSNVSDDLTGYYPYIYKKHKWYYYIAPWHWGDSKIYKDGEE